MTMEKEIKRFSAPEMSVIRFDEKDVIATSEGPAKLSQAIFSKDSALKIEGGSASHYWD